MSLLLMIGSQAIEPVDWTVIRAMDSPESLPLVAGILGTYDPTRCEALLHTWPTDAPPLPRTALGERLGEVEAAMETFRAEGLTTSRDDVESMALAG